MKTFKEFLQESTTTSSIDKLSQSFIIGKALKIKSFANASDFDIKRLAKLVKTEYEIENLPKPITNTNKYTKDLVDIDKQFHKINGKYMPSPSEWNDFKKNVLSGKFNHLLK